LQIKKAGVVGCGTMGRGIAEVSVRAGYPVLISDIQKEALDRTTGALGVMLTREVRTGKIDEETKSAILGRFKQTMDMADFSECDLVIEAVVENSEAVRLPETGVATAEEIDRAVVLGLNHPMGPFKLLDFIGIDIACYMAEYISANLKASHIARSALLDKMVAENATGRKSGKGFYKYG